MNKEHLQYCAGPEWADTVRQFVIPWSTRGIDLGDHLLEVGPGPGATTDILRLRVPRLTAVEVDPDLALQLASRLSGSNVTVTQADATDLPFEGGRFSAAICLTMLHHVSTSEQQDRLFGEMLRTVRPGGVVLGSDNLDSPGFRAFHEGDVCLPLDPTTLQKRLESIGFSDVLVETNEFAYRFVAHVPRQ